MDILIIAPNDFKTLERKSVLYQYENYREGGFFNNVISFFPLTKKYFKTSIEDNKFFYQYGWSFRWSLVNKIKFFKLLGTVFLVLKIIFVFPFSIKKFDIKIIRATDPYIMGLIGLYYSRLFKIPIVISVHSDYDLCNKANGLTFKLLGSRRLAERLEHYVYSRCDGILPITKYLINRIRSSYPDINSNKFYRFPHGIEVNDFDNVEYLDIYKKFNIPKDIKVICYVARLSAEKNCLDLPLIVESLSKKMKKFIVLIVGDGKEATAIKFQINEQKLDKYVKMVGFQENIIVVNARKAASVNLCLLDGYSLIEAGLSKRPVVAYDVEWHSDLILNRENGFLSKLHDVDSVSENIYKLLENEDLSNILGSALRKVTIENHEIKNTQKIKQEIFKKVMKDFIC